MSLLEAQIVTPNTFVRVNSAGELVSDILVADIATNAYVDNAIAALIGLAPSDLDTLQEIASDLNLKQTKLLTGYTLGSSVAIADTDNVLQGFGKAQAQINTNASGIAANVTAIATINTTLGTVVYLGSSQSVTGIKTFTQVIKSDGGIDVTATGGSDVLNIGTSNADIINIGWSGAQVVIQGSVFSNNVTNLEIADKLIRLNKGGTAASASSTGFEIEENAIVTGYFATNSSRDGYDFKAPSISDYLTISLASLTGHRTLTAPDGSGTIARTSDLSAYELSLGNPGTNGYALVSTTAGVRSWVAFPATSPLTTKGDLYTYSTTNARLAVGTNGQLIKADSAASTGLSWFGLTNNSVVFWNSGLSQDNNNFYWDATNHILSVNTAGDFGGTDAINIYGMVDSFFLNGSSVVNGFSNSHSRGTVATPAPSLANDYVGVYGFYHYTSAWVEGASVKGYVEGASTTNAGMRLELHTKANAGALIKALTIDSTQQITPANDILFNSGKGLKDINGNYLIKFPTTVASAVNYLTVTNAATLSGITIGVGGSDTNVSLTLTTQGSGNLVLTNPSGNISIIKSGTTFIGITSTMTLTQIASILTGTSGSLIYRLTNAGSNVTAQVMIDPANSVSTAGSLAYCFDSSNGFVLTHANGTLRVRGWSVKLTNLVNTAGSESSDLTWSPQNTVDKFIIGGALNISTLTGSTSRMVEIDSSGNISATEDIVNIFITDSTIITQLTTVLNWTGVIYTGSAISGATQGQIYNDGTYFYIMVDNVTPIRCTRT